MTDPIQDVLSRLDSAADEGRKFQILLIGSSEDITETIHTLNRLNYAEAGGWSPVLPVPNSTQMMSILTRVRFLQS